MADTMVREIEEGIAGCGVRCGVIGEIGCSYPLMDCEKRALQAAAMAQTRTGMSTDNYTSTVKYGVCVCVCVWPEEEAIYIDTYKLITN